MQNYSPLQGFVAVQNKIFVEDLRLLTVLKEHELGIPIHKYQVSKAERVQEWHCTTEEKTHKQDNNDLGMNQPCIELWASVQGV